MEFSWSLKETGAVVGRNDNEMTKMMVLVKLVAQMGMIVLLVQMVMVAVRWG